MARREHRQDTTPGDCSHSRLLYLLCLAATGWVYMRCACGTLTVLGSWCSASLFCSGEDMGFLCIVGRLCGPPDRHACFHLSKPRVGLEQVRGRGVRRHVLCVSSNRSYRSCPPWTERKKQGELAHRRRASVLARAAPQKERTAVIKQIPRRWNEEIQGDLFPRHTAQVQDGDPMKKVSTGERIKFADLRRRSTGGPRGDADSDVMSEQRFVSELMDTTPSSSLEGETLRDGYVYNPPDATVVDVPLVGYESDGEAADEVVTGTQEGVGNADLIVKEDVPEIPGETQQGSLLAAGLAAVKISASQPGQAGLLAPARQRDDTHSDGESLMGDPRVDHGTDHGPGGCTAEQLIESLVSECKSLELGDDLTQEADKYVLRMADDDWDPDLDFPGLDSSAVITDVGVDQFVLCLQTKIEPMLHITIVLHKGLNGPLTGTGAMEAPGAGAGATMTLEVDFQTPGQEGTHHMSMPIAPDNNQLDLVRFRDSGLRSSAASAAVEEVEELLGMGTGGKDKSPGKEAAAEETVKIRNIDTGEDIALTEIDARVPPSLDPGELFRTKDVS